MEYRQGSLVLLLAMPAVAVAAPENFGVIDIAGHRHPQFIYAEPRHGSAAAAGREPVYLHVPRDHTKQWSQYCSLYKACDRPAFFVSEEWFYGTFLGMAKDGVETESAAGDGAPAVRR